MARNPYEIWQNWQRGGQYPGSSGLYWDESSYASPYDQSRTGFGYAGDQAKNAAARSLGLTPQSIGTGVDSWTGSTVGQDSPVLGQDGRWYSSKTGKIFSGTDSRTGKSYNNGYENIDVADRYKAVNVVKDPAVADETSKLLDTFKSDAASALTGFSDHLANFNTDIGNARTLGNKALDTSGFEAQMTGAQRKYAGALDTAAQGYQDLNAQNAAAEQGIVQQAYDTLPQYDAAAQAIGDRQLAQLNQNLSKYKLGTDTPRSMSSSDANVLARNVADVQLPLEQAKIARKLDLLQNLSLPVQRELYGNERSRITQFDPQIAQQEFASGQATAQTIQGVRQQVAQMAPGLAVQYMQSLGVPAQLQQQILSGQLGQLGQISQLNTASNYQGLMDQAGAYPNQAQYYNLGIPGYPSAQSPTLRSPTYPSTSNTLGGPGGGNAPVTVSPTQQWNDYWTQRGAPSNVAGGRGQFMGNYLNAQGNSYYDSATGTMRDRTTGEITGYANGYPSQDNGPVSLDQSNVAY